MSRDALAFWLREPGVGEIRPVALAEPGRTTCWCARCAPASAAAPRRWSSAAASRRASTRPCARRSRRATFPAPVKYGYLNVGVVEQGPPDLRGRTVFCLYPHQTALRRAGGAVVVVPDDVPPARAVLAGTVETAVNALWDCRTAGRRPDRRRRRRHGRLLRRAAAGPDSRARRSPWSTSTRPGRRRRRARRRLRVARPTPTGGCDLVVHTQRDVGRAAASLDLLGPEGDGDRAQLVRRRGRHALARRRVPLAAARHPGQPGRPGGTGAPRHAGRRPTGSRSRSTCCATRPSTRCSPGRRGSTSCPR